MDPKRGLIVVPLVVSASVMSASAAVLEEVTVTAQKREQSLQDVGISVTAFSGDQLKELGVQNTIDITQQVPGLQLTTFTPAFTIFSLRGVSQNNFQDNLEAPVAVYLDGAYVANMNAINTSLFDMERTEVLRGPQGTLFGRNTTGGLLHFITRGADDDELNGYLEVSAAQFSNYAVEGAVGGALNDRVRGRLAGRWEEADGYVESITPGVRDSHGENGYALRGSMQVDVSDSLLADIRINYAEDTDVPSGSYTVRGASFDPTTGFGTFAGAPSLGPLDSLDNLEHSSLSEGRFDREMFGITGTLTWNLDNGMELVSITNYMDMETDYFEDAGSGLLFFEYSKVHEFDSVSQELRLSGDNGPLTWQVGGYYLDMTFDTFQSVSGAGINFSPDPAVPYRGTVTDAAISDTFGLVDSRNWSLFGQVEYQFAPAWTAIAGLRYSRDDKEIAFTRFFEDAGQPFARVQEFDIAAAGVPGLDEIEYGDFAARFQLNWTPDDDTLVYASFNRGIKGGNWSIDPLGAVTAADLKHGEEVLHSYEVGAKTSFLEGLGRVNLSAFYYDYSDYQAFSLLNLTPQVANSDAEAYGGEVEIILSPVDGLDLMFGAALMDSEVDAVPTVFDRTLTVEAELPRAPTVSLNWLARYQWNALAGNLAVQVDGNYNGEQYIEGTNAQVSLEDAYTVVNASASYTTPDEHWKASIWVKNLGDTEYRLYNLDLGLLGFVQQVFAPPRWVGGTVSYRF